MLQWLETYLKKSSKRLGMILATASLCAIALSVGLTIAGRIAAKGDVGMGAVAALSAATVPLAGLTGAAYHRKPDLDAPAAPDDVDAKP